MTNRQQTEATQLSNRALMELIKLTREQNARLEEISQKQKSTRLTYYVLAGLMMACFLAAFWVYLHLIGTSIGYFDLLMDYVDGSEYNSSAFQSTESLFVILARFILGVGLLWLPASVLISMIDKLVAALKAGIGGLIRWIGNDPSGGQKQK